MNKTTVLRHYCTGCGLCHSFEKVDFSVDKKGYEWPEIVTEEQAEMMLKVCPSSGIQLPFMDSSTIWGNYRSAYYGFATDKEIRKKASSGGILTALSIYLITENVVDGVIQTCADPQAPHKTITVVNRDVKSVLKCMGSRYSISMPLYNIESLCEENRKYAFIGKPCDVSALRMYINNVNPSLGEKIPYTFSFFCAGEPSEEAQMILLSHLGCKKISDCKSLSYRGNGWPGLTTCENIDGNKHYMSYSASWGKILGRDIRVCCRFCMDGIGEFADISCGDAWYLKSDNSPDFNERDGRSIVFARTSIGEKMISDATEKGYIKIEIANVPELKYSQLYQYDRKSTMISKMLAMKTLRKVTPLYSLKEISKFMKFSNPKRLVKVFMGTISRAKQGKM